MPRYRASKIYIGKYALDPKLKTVSEENMDLNTQSYIYTEASQSKMQYWPKDQGHWPWSSCENVAMAAFALLDQGQWSLTHGIAQLSL